MTPLEVSVPFGIDDTIFVMLTKFHYVNLKVMDFVYYPECGFCVIAGYYGIPKSIKPISKLGEEFFTNSIDADLQVERNKKEAKVYECEGNT